jgi:hypothetical protein
VPFDAGVSSQLQTERRGLSVRTQTSSFALTDPGSPSQTVMVSKLLLHRRAQHAARIPENRYCCGDGAVSSLRTQVRMDSPVNPRGSLHTSTSFGLTRRSDNPVPCRSSGSFPGDPITIPRAPCGWTPDPNSKANPELRELSVKQKKRWPNQTVRLQSLKVRKTAAVRST